jgi:hypothetical protein
VAQEKHAYEVHQRKDHRGLDLISDALPFGALWYGEPNAISNAIDYAKFYSRSHAAVIRIYDDVGNVIETPNMRASSRLSMGLVPSNFVGEMAEIEVVSANV